MQAERFGIITFFGILVPGTYLAGAIVLAVAGTLELLDMQGHSTIFKFVKENAGLSATSFFFIAYLFGIVARMTPPDYLDRLSTIYLRHIRGKNDPASEPEISDPFPYHRFLERRLEDSGLACVTDFMEKHNPEYASPRNYQFFNYCKLLIDARNEALSKQWQQIEALIRFLSGTALAIWLAIICGIVFSFLFALDGRLVMCIVYGGIAALSLLVLIQILEGFKSQRRREVLLVWCSFYILTKATEGSKGYRDAATCCPSSRELHRRIPPLDF